MRAGFSIETSLGQVRFSTALVSPTALEISNPDENLDTVLGLIESWTCLLADSPLNRTSKSDKPPRVFHEWFTLLTTTPIQATIVRLSKLSHVLVSQPTLYGSGTSTGDWISEFRDLPIFREYHEWFKTGDARILRYIYTFLNFGKKMKYVDDTLEKTAFRGWTSVEERLHDLVLDPSLTRNLRAIMDRLVPKLVGDRPFGPRYGPGRVSEPGIFGIVGKTDSLAYDAKLDHAFFRSHYVSYGLRGELGFTAEKVIPDPLKWNGASDSSRRYSRLKFVPKDMTKSRSICAEPNTYMFFQQGLADLLVSGMRDTIASRFIDISDQSRNRMLAQYGSITGDIDTIDLSAASDSVSVDLVKQIFPRELLFFLLASRTARVQVPDGRIIEVKKFAPMGSALCFPVQCLVFTSIVILAAMLEERGHPVGTVPGEVLYSGMDVDRFVARYFQATPGYIHPGLQQCNPAVVYGDDICVDSKLTPHVFHLLTSLGFEVNTSKSFTGSQCFRESCGGYYYQGEDVTPLFYRVQGRSKGHLGYGFMTSVISLANHAGDRGLRHLRRLSIHLALFEDVAGIRPNKGKNPVIFSNSIMTSTCIKTTRERMNEHLAVRFNKDLQRDESRCVSVSVERYVLPTAIQADGLEKYVMVQWWNSHRAAVSECFSHSVARRDPSGSRLRLGWVPI